MVLPHHPDHGNVLGPRHLNTLADIVEDRRGARDEEDFAGRAKVILHVDDEQGALFGHFVFGFGKCSTGEERQTKTRQREGKGRGEAGEREGKGRGEAGEREERGREREEREREEREESGSLGDAFERDNRIQTHFFFPLSLDNLRRTD